MIPTSPVITNAIEHEVTYAKDQKEYVPLPVIRTEKAILSRWKLTDEERAHIAAGGDLFIVQLYFGENLQPICPVAGSEEEALETLMNIS